MNYLSYGVIGALLILLIVFIYLLTRGKISNTADYRGMFVLGIVFVPVGIAMNIPAFWALGTIYVILGLANRKKWGERTKFSELPPEERKIKIATTIILALLVLFGLIVYLLVR